MYNEARIKELLLHLPLPPGGEIPPGVTETELLEFQERTGITLPTELCDWLRISNAPFIGSQGALGIKTRSKYFDIEYYYDLFPIWKVQFWVPVGADGSGNYYVIPTRNEFGTGFPVLFIDTHDNANAPAYIVASSVGHFLEFLIERELGMSKWPFDKAEVATKDPDILAFRGVDLPWERT
jgi:hypothetical protein